ncbi:MAG: Rid family hydrolase [Candidatus Dormibacteria bacterium]
MSVQRQRVSSGAPWEAVAGYSRAVRAGNHVAVSGTVGRNVDGTVPAGAYAQATRAIAIIDAALAEVGCGLEQVIRTRIFVTSIGDFDEVARAHAEAFAAVRPATSMVEVSRLVDDVFLLEIEADAVIG